MYLIPPMDDEPPRAYVLFVTVHLAELYEAAPDDTLVVTDVLADVAGHWRRLCWYARLTAQDEATAYLRRRLSARLHQWEDEESFEADMRVLPASLPWQTDAAQTVAPQRSAAAQVSLALRKADVIAGPPRHTLMPAADAGIAWVHAYRRQQWHRAQRLLAGAVLLLGAVIQLMSQLATPY